VFEPIASVALRVQDRLLGDGPVARIALVLVAVVGAGIAMLQFPPNHDVAAILDLAGRTLDGERLYVDIPEVNPPLIFFLAAAVVRASRHTGLSDLWLASMTALAWAGVAIVLAGRLLVRALSLSTADARALSGAALLVCTAGWAEHLGQREHIWFCATLPYLAALVLRGQGQRPTEPEALLTGAMAAVGFAFKPMFLGVALVGEVWLLVVRRDPRALVRREAQVLVASAITYAAYVIFGTEYLDSIHHWASNHPAYDSPYELMWPSSRPLVWGAGLLAVVAVPLPEAWRRLRWLALGLLAAWQGSAWIQHKDWEYHFAPLWMGSALLPAVLVLGADVRGQRWRFGPLCVLLGTLTGLAHAWTCTTDRWTSPQTAALGALTARLDDYAPGGPVLALTSDAYPTFPAIRMVGDHLVNRASTMLVPGMYPTETMRRRPFPYHPIDEMSPLERATLTGLVDDVERTHPNVILAAIGPYKQGFGFTSFDWLDYMSLDQRWPGLLAHYQEVPGTPGFRIFLRTDLLVPAPSPPPNAPGAAP